MPAVRSFGRLASKLHSIDRGGRNLDRTEGQPMKIVVIGGSGLIGTKTVAILRQGGHEVVAGSPKAKEQKR
jgi:NADPH:quinone reductase-like Zn-dependent oxidoreductase